MTNPGDGTTSTVVSDWLRPFASILILECTGSNPAQAFLRLVQEAKRFRANARATTAIIATGLSGADNLFTDNNGNTNGFDEIDAFVLRRDTPPSWAQVDSGYVDIEHQLFLALRRRILVGVHCDPAVRDRLLRWIDREPKPELRRVDHAILQGAFIQGEAKGLWLRGTHARRTTRPDSKTISGQRLQDALNPFEDSSFAMSSARSSLPDDASRTALRGTVGTTPKSALVWNNQTANFEQFTQVIREALVLVETTLATNSGTDRPLPILIQETQDLSSALGAYDVAVRAPEDVAAQPDSSQELWEAAAKLEGAILEISGDDTSSSFALTVGFDGASAGVIGATPTKISTGVSLRFGLRGAPTDHVAVQEILEALNEGSDLLSIYYRSGHMVETHGIYLPEIRTMPFDNWNFKDFSGYAIKREKPSSTTSTQDIHDAVGLAGDTSLFGWTVENYAEGWLTCDDGAGEIADFIHVHPSGVVSLVHVKGAHSDTSLRSVAVGAYEVVVSQASKNLGYMNRDLLSGQLASSNLEKPACWTDGQRVSDRAEILDALACTDASDPFKIVIVQPHVSEVLRKRIKANPGLNSGSERLRMNRLESLLNTARGAAIQLGGEFEVVSSLA